MHIARRKGAALGLKDSRGDRMSERIQDRLFAACGVASVVLLLVGSSLGSAGGQPSYTLSSSSAHIANELAKPVDSLGWAGAYIELLSFGPFLAFAVWACTKLGGGLLGTLAGAAAAIYTALNLAALGVMDALAYRAGHGVDVQLGTALANVSSALFVASWIASAFFLLSAGLLALISDRSILGWSAIGIALVILVLTPALVERGGQVGYFLWLLWVARREHRPRPPRTRTHVSCRLQLARARLPRVPTSGPDRRSLHERKADGKFSAGAGVSGWQGSGQSRSASSRSPGSCSPALQRLPTTRPMSRTTSPANTMLP